MTDLIDPEELAALENAIETAQSGDFFELSDREAHMCRAIYLDPMNAAVSISGDELADVELFAGVMEQDYEEGRTRGTTLTAAQHSTLRILRRAARRTLADQ